MSKIRVFGRAGLALSIAAQVASAAAAQSEDPPLGQDKPGPFKGITVPCCRCADGSVLTADISTGTAAWRVSPPSGAPAGAVTTPPVGPWTTALSPAQWVRHPTVSDAGGYVYETRYRVQNCAIPAQVTVSGDFSADNSASLTIGTPTPVFTAPGPTAFTSTFPFSKVVGVGMGTVSVAVTNNEGPTGMVLRGTITVRCPRELLTD